MLNAIRVELPKGWRRGTFNGYVLSWDPTVVARLRELHESGRVELQWLTTWTELADQLLAEPMGLPRGLRTHSRDGVLPTGYGEERRGISGWWKLAAARAVAEADRRGTPALLADREPVQWSEGMYLSTSGQTVWHGIPFRSASMRAGELQRNQ